MNKTFLFTTICLLLCTSIVSSQTWLETYVHPTFISTPNYSIKKTINGYKQCVYKGSHNILEVDHSGNTIGTQASFGSGITSNISGWDITNNEGYIVTSNGQANGLQAVILNKLSSSGSQAWSKSFGFYINPSLNHGTSVIQTSDGGYLLGGARSNAPSGDASAFIIKTNSSGNELWSYDIPVAKYGVSGSYYSSRVYQVEECLDMGYIATLGLSSSAVIKLDSMGNLEWSKAVGVRATVLPTPDSCYIITQETNPLILNNTPSPSTANKTITKLDANGNTLWNKVYQGPTTNVFTSIINTNDGGFMMIGYTKGFIYNQGHDDFLFVKMDSNANVLWETSFGGMGNDIVVSILELPNGNFVFSGVTTSYGVPHRNLVIAEVDSMARLDPNIFSNLLSGDIYKDDDLSCTRQSNEPLVANLANLSTTINNNIIHLSSSTGEYMINMDSNTYTVHLNLNSPYWQACQDSQQVTFNGYHLQDSLDFGIQPIINCPELHIDVNAPFVRRCLSTTYSISYCNTGTISANNAYVEIELDTSFTFDSSTVTLTSQNGNIYHFDVGSIAVGACGDFQISVTENCNSQLGQVHCTEARIFPDTVCIPHWDITDSCTLDSILFTVYNNGITNGQASYWIAEDSTVIDTGFINLSSGAQWNKSVYSNAGSSYALVLLPQGSTTPISNIAHNCKGPTVTNHVSTWVPNNPPISSRKTHCEANRGSYDPNDKYGFPTGFGIEHNILPNTPLDYRIRFQNTGTDTAFKVVIIDTLPVELDPLSIQVGAASHYFTWELTGQGIITFIFDNIMLPDSNINELASHGFVTFHIEPKANLVLGTRIENKASIYFDFNEAIVTNTDYHTIQDSFPAINITQVVTSLVETNLDKTLKFKIFPNPTKGTLHIEQSQIKIINIQLFNINGQQILNTQTSQKLHTLKLEKLPKGTYVIRLTSDAHNEVHKIIIQ